MLVRTAVVCALWALMANAGVPASESINFRAAPITVHGTVLVPARDLLSAVAPDATLAWDADTGTATFARGQSSLVVTVGSVAAQAEGAQASLAVAPRLKDGVIFVPLRTLASWLGLEVAYQAGEAPAIVLTRGDDSWSFPCPQKEAPPDADEVAWKALFSGIAAMHDRTKDGVFVFDWKTKQPKLFVPGEAFFEPWAGGIKGYGVIYVKGIKGNGLGFPNDFYTGAFPQGLRQVADGTYTNAAGDTILKGISALPGGPNREKAWGLVAAVGAIIADRLKEDEEALAADNAFTASTKGMTADQIFVAGLTDENWAVRQSMYVDLFEARISKAEFVLCLLEAFADRAPQVRQIAANYAARVQDPCLILPLQKLLSDDQSLTRWYAIGALVKQGDKGSLELLRAMKRDDPAKSIRQLADWACQVIPQGGAGSATVTLSGDTVLDMSGLQKGH